MNMTRAHLVCIAICFLFSAKCSGEVVHKVIGGEPAKKGNIPYIVSIQRTRRHTCGGSILDELHILTAAHCVTDIHPSELIIQYGVTNLAKEKHNTIQVANYKYHDNYDIAILTLATNIPLSKEVKPIELPGENSVEDAKVILAGWGKIRDYGSASDKLQVVEITVFSDDECDEIYKGFPHKTDRLHQICAGVMEGGKGQCTGDSGGPLVLLGTRIQVGIVSWSKKPCASKGHPGVFVRVSGFIDWIHENWKENTHTEL